LALPRVFQYHGTEGIFELVCIDGALYPIYVNWFCDVSCIPRYVLEADMVQSDPSGCK
jgi:hypothetical protein